MVAVEPASPRALAPPEFSEVQTSAGRPPLPGQGTGRALRCAARHGPSGAERSRAEQGPAREPLCAALRRAAQTGAAYRSM